MGLFDELRRELAHVAEAAKSAAEEEARRQAGKQNASVPANAPPRAPARRLAVVTCMDTRGHLERALGLRPGDAHILRNAGGLVTDDVLRSLVVSHHALGTREIFVVGHTDCAMMRFRDADLRAQIPQKTGASAPLSLGSFTDLEESVRRQVARVRSHPCIPAQVSVRGFVFDLRSGALRELKKEDAPAGESGMAQGRVDGRLQRQGLERIAPALPSMPPGPSGEDFRRKVEAMTGGEPDALGALSVGAAAAATEASSLTFGPRDVLRAIVLSGALDEPRGRRALRPRQAGRHGR